MSFLARTKFTIARVLLHGLRALNHALLAAEPSAEDAAEREASVFQPRNFWS